MLQKIIASHSAEDCRDQQSRLGQFMTPKPIAEFMASWLEPLQDRPMHILDAGSGRGALSCALAESWKGQGSALDKCRLTLFEIDETLQQELSQNTAGAGYDHVSLEQKDFILESAKQRNCPVYTHAILNPPYKKISSKSSHRLALRELGIETGNLYSGFIAIALQQLIQGGQLVAIIPRSFCNGPYFKPFRKMLLQCGSLTHIHLFGSRTHAFQADGVLQENIIIRLVKGEEQSAVEVSTSAQSDFHQRTNQVYDFSHIVYPNDDDQFIHIPSAGEVNTSILTKTDKRVNLQDIRVQISTGPVVGFRLREHLRHELDVGSAPLVYPAHLRGGRVRWPLETGAKANAIVINDDTQKWLFPNGCYCVVRRFSSKEEKHRIVASVVEQEDFPCSKMLGLDNKLNVFHFAKNGLDRSFIHGLAAYLNTDIVDEEFRLFSGHTQVNATDLRRMKYPRRELIEHLGRQITACDHLPQDDIYYILEI